MYSWNDKLAETLELSIVYSEFSVLAEDADTFLLYVIHALIL